IFGNRDGQVLDDPANKASKIKTKDQVITQIVGYKPQTHVSIEYIESLDDWKTAWDHIHFRGFLGTKMIMQVIWQGCDSSLAGAPHAWPAFLLGEQKQGLRDALARNGLAISNVNAFMMHAVNDARQRYWHPSWIEPDRHYRQVRIDHTRRALTLARELGAPCITTEPGGPVEPGGSWSTALKLFVEMLKPVAQHAEKEGVLLLVEPEPGLLIESS